MEMEMKGMKGVAGSRAAAFCKTASDARRALEAGKVAAAAEDYGAVIVWRDDSGTLRGDRQKFRHSEEECEFSSMTKALKWFTAACKQIKVS